MQHEQSMASSRKLFTSKVKLLLNLKKAFQPIINIFSPIQTKYQIHSNNSWLKFTKCSNVIGHVHFSVEYIYTLKKLNVIISHLTGVSNFGKIDCLFPSQIQTKFIVVLQLRPRIDFSLKNKKEFHKENDHLHRLYFTTPVETFANPCFDQLFVFDIPFNELKHSELVFSVLYSTTLNDQSADYDDDDDANNNNNSHEEPCDFNKIFNLPTSVSSHHQFNQLSMQSGKMAHKMQCIGEAVYCINSEKLINYPDELLHNWQELYPPLNSYDHSTVEKKLSLMNKNDKLNRETSDENYSLLQEISFYELPDKSMAQLSTVYTKWSSSLKLYVKTITNLKVCIDETELIFRATYCLNNISLQSVTSQPLKIIKLENCKIETTNEVENGYILDHIKIPSNEYLTLNVEINELINYRQNIQIIFEIFIQTGLTGHVHCLSRIVLCSTKNNDVNDKNHESASSQYYDLIRELYRIKESNSIGSTKKITYWYQINRS
ncbi:unnamed protein product [Schistosoma turkestanicum]|nr:unnamed protein product [Schistosoma turkestanicum]